MRADARSHDHRESAFGVWYHLVMVSAAPSHTILQRMIEPLNRELPVEVARFFLDLSFTQADESRIAELSEKANEGDLTGAENEELATYVLLGDFLTIMHSTARRSMPTTPQGK